MIEVYHLNDKAFVPEVFTSWEQVDKRYMEAQMGFKEDHAKAVTSLFNEGGYVLVAKVDTNSLSEAWEKTNSIEDSWVKNKEVQAFVDESRSSKVGDVFKDENGQFHTVASIGFTKLDGIIENRPRPKIR